MWAQMWDNIYSLVVPYPKKASVDVTDQMKQQVNYITNAKFFNKRENKNIRTFLTRIIIIATGLRCEENVSDVERLLHFAWPFAIDGLVLDQFND